MFNRKVIAWYFIEFLPSSQLQYFGLYTAPGN